MLRDDVLAVAAEERDRARKLVGMSRRPIGATSRVRPEVRPGKIEVLDLALLPRQQVETHRPAVDARRCARLEARHLQTHALQLLGQVGGRGLAGTTAGERRRGPYVDAAA